MVRNGATISYTGAAAPDQEQTVEIRAESSNQEYVGPSRGPRYSYADYPVETMQPPLSRNDWRQVLIRNALLVWSQNRVEFLDRIVQGLHPCIAILCFAEAKLH